MTFEEVAFNAIKISFVVLIGLLAVVFWIPITPFIMKLYGTAWVFWLVVSLLFGFHYG